MQKINKVDVLLTFGSVTTASCGRLIFRLQQNKTFVTRSVLEIPHVKELHKYSLILQDLM